MPEIISRPKTKRKGGKQKKCPICKTVAVYYPDDYWTEYGNTEARCAGCNDVLFLGRFGFPDTY